MHERIRPIRVMQDLRGALPMNDYTIRIKQVASPRRYPFVRQFAILYGFPIPISSEYRVPMYIIPLRNLAILAVLLGAAALASCGKTGDLYLPNEDRAAQRQ